MNQFTNHEKTSLLEGLFENYNWLEKLLVYIGLERVVVFLRAQNMEGVSAMPSHDVAKDDFPLLNNDFD